MKRKASKGILLGILVAAVLMFPLSASWAYEYLAVNTDINQDYIALDGVTFLPGFNLTGTVTLSDTFTTDVLTKYATPMGSNMSPGTADYVYLSDPDFKFYLESTPDPWFDGPPYGLTSIAGFADAYGQVYGETTITYTQPFTASGLVSYEFGASVFMDHFGDAIPGEYAKGLGWVKFEIGSYDASSNPFVTGFQYAEWSFDSTDPASFPSFDYFTNSPAIIALGEGVREGTPLSFDYGSTEAQGFIRATAFSSADIFGVPEPATMLLLGLGLMGVAGIGRKFKELT